MRALLFLVAALPFRVLTPARYRALAARAADTRADSRFLGAVDGDALCENMVLCFRAGKPFAFDPFLVNEKVVVGRVAETVVEEVIASTRFRVIQTDVDVLAEPDPTQDRQGAIERRGRFTRHTLAALRRHYRLDRVSANGAFYIPK